MCVSGVCLCECVCVSVSMCVFGVCVSVRMCYASLTSKNASLYPAAVRVSLCTPEVQQHLANAYVKASSHIFTHTHTHTYTHIHTHTHTHTHINTHSHINTTHTCMHTRSRGSVELKGGPRAGGAMAGLATPDQARRANAAAQMRSGIASK